MTVISQQVNKVYHQGKNPTNSIDIGVSFKNFSVITRKLADNTRTYAGENNVLMGYQSGGNTLHGKNNVLIGSYVGEHLDSKTMDNTVIGDRSARHLTSGQRNIFIGKDNCTNNYSSNLRYNTIIGSDSDTYGTHNTIIGNASIVENNSNIVLGNNNTSRNDHSISIGNNNFNEAPNSVLVGENVRNHGSNSAIFLINNKDEYCNYSNDHINLFNILS